MAKFKEVNAYPSQEAILGTLTLVRAHIYYMYFLYLIFSLLFFRFGPW